MAFQKLLATIQAQGPFQGEEALNEAAPFVERLQLAPL